MLVMQTLSAILPTVTLYSRHRLTRSISRSRIPNVLLALCPCTRHAQREETAQSDAMKNLRWKGNDGSADALKKKVQLVNFKKL